LQSEIHDLKEKLQKAQKNLAHSQSQSQVEQNLKETLKDYQSALVEKDLNLTSLFEENKKMIQ
jgi:hypothetical protein